MPIYTVTYSLEGSAHKRTMSVAADSPEQAKELFAKHFNNEVTDTTEQQPKHEGLYR